MFGRGVAAAAVGEASPSISAGTRMRCTITFDVMCFTPFPVVKTLWRGKDAQGTMPHDRIQDEAAVESPVHRRRTSATWPRGKGIWLVDSTPCRFLLATESRCAKLTLLLIVPPTDSTPTGRLLLSNRCRVERSASEQG